MSKMSELDLMIRNHVEPMHKRLLAAQKDIQNLKNAAYADHRLIEKMNTRMDQLIKQFEDDGK